MRYFEGVKKLKTPNCDCSRLRGSRLRGSRLRGSRLRGSRLRGPRLRGSRLRGSRLRGSRLRVARLRGARLRGARLRGARLRGARLRGARLRGARLRGARLRGARLRGARLRGARLRGARLRRATQLIRRGASMRSNKATTAHIPRHSAEADKIPLPMTHTDMSHEACHVTLIQELCAMPPINKDMVIHGEICLPIHNDNDMDAAEPTASQPNINEREQLIRSHLPLNTFKSIFNGQTNVKIFMVLTSALPSKFEPHIVINWLPGNLSTQMFTPLSPENNPPITNETYITELHHGSWWTELWKQICNENEEILVPIIFYMDGISLDAHGCLSLTPLNMTLGSFNVEERKGPDAWTTIYFHPDTEIESIKHKKKKMAKDNIQNLHTALAAALQSFKQVLYKVKMKFAIAFVVGDTELHGKLCGRYRSYTEKVKKLCYDFETPPNMFAREYKDCFKSISHHPMKNAFHSFNFGCNINNIHFAIPGECLHMHQLGVAQMAICGALLSRQLDHDFPRTKFSSQLLSITKKEGHDYSGMLISILITLVSNHGNITISGLEHLPNKMIIHFINCINFTCLRGGMGTKLIKNHLYFHLLHVLINNNVASTMRWVRSSKKTKPYLSPIVLTFVCHKVLLLLQDSSSVKRFTEHNRLDPCTQQNNLFPSHPLYCSDSGQLNSVWYDWALFDVNACEIPCQILCFLELYNLKEPSYSFVSEYKIADEDTYAAVTKFESTPTPTVSSFVTRAVVPQLDAMGTFKTNSYLVVSNRRAWLDEFHKRTSSLPNEDTLYSQCTIVQQDSDNNDDATNSGDYSSMTSNNGDDSEVSSDTSNTQLFTYTINNLVLLNQNRAMRNKVLFLKVIEALHRMDGLGGNIQNALVDQQSRGEPPSQDGLQVPSVLYCSSVSIVA
eukprot:jgi/Psemu1/40002/gm1.40002_g